MLALVARRAGAASAARHAIVCAAASAAIVPAGGRLLHSTAPRAADAVERKPFMKPVERQFKPSWEDQPIVVRKGRKRIMRQRLKARLAELEQDETRPEQDQHDQFWARVLENQFRDFDVDGMDLDISKYDPDEGPGVLTEVQKLEEFYKCWAEEFKKEFTRDIEEFDPAVHGEPKNPDAILQFTCRFYPEMQNGRHIDGAFKVVLEVKTIDLKLAPAELERLAALVGPRLSKNGVLKLTSDKYHSILANKAYLRELLSALVAEAKNTGLEPLPTSQAPWRNQRQRAK